MMKRHKLMSIILSVLWMITIIIMPVGAVAEGGNTLSIEYIANGVPVVGTLFTIYQALDGAGELTGDFEQYKEEIEVGDFTDSEAMSVLSDTLYAYTVRDKLIPLTAGMTNANGKVKFDNLKTGVYLIVGASAKQGDVVYTIKPCIISLPYINDRDEEESSVILTPKYAVRPMTSEEISYSVRKVWKNDGILMHPKEVEMQLLENGEVVDTVFLNQENDWQYTWKYLSSESEYLVMEANVPVPYKVSITRNDTDFIITNTFNEDSSSFQGWGDPTETEIDETGETVPNTDETGETEIGETNESKPSTDKTDETETDQPETDQPETDTTDSVGHTTASSSNNSQTTTRTVTSSNSKNTNLSTVTNTSSKSNSNSSNTKNNTQNNAQISTLPQTGQLWWPVPVLFIAGMVLFLGGIVDCQLSRNENT